ncbi:MAG TPA: hypothetical protein VKT49_09575 [Bryobacteraceae bacterium]|nr:hypothetical protein [Bryobacteraceae bacterium]
MRILAFLLLSCAAHAAAFRYWVAPCSKPESGCHRDDPELAQWAVEAWQAASGGALTFERVPEESRAQIRIYWAGGNDGLYGETRPILVGGVRGAEVYVLPTAGANDDPLLRDAIVYLTCLHETGHALGLAHTAAFADIMYSFQFGGDIPEYFGRYRRLLSTRADIRKHSGMSEADRRHLAAIFR